MKFHKTKIQEIRDPKIWPASGPFPLGLRHWARSGYANVIDDGSLSPLSSVTHVASDVVAHHGRVDADERYPRRPVVDDERSGKLPQMDALSGLIHFAVSQLQNRTRYMVDKYKTEIALARCIRCGFSLSTRRVGGGETKRRPPY